MAYPTPGVDVKERSLFPPSVAQVETAVPAFLGYTEKATYTRADDLRLVAKRISSLKEYERYYGGGPAIAVNRIDLDADNNVVSTDLQQDYILYDSLKVFFANGGGDCYIISVGSYTDIVSKPHFDNGLEILKRIDEPTLILFPDLSQNLTKATGYYDIQKAALMQSGELMDRFCILDVPDMLDPKLNDLANKPNFDLAIQELRDNIGMNELKFGAAYTPWINANIPKNLTYNDIRTQLFKNNNPVTIQSLTTTLSVSDKNTVNAILTAYDNLLIDKDEIVAQVAGHFPGATNIKDHYQKLVELFKTNATTLPATVATLNAARDNFSLMIQTALLFTDMMDDLLVTGPPATITDSTFRGDIDAIVTGLAASLTLLCAYDNGLAAANAAGNVVLGGNAIYPLHTTAFNAEWEIPLTTAWTNAALTGIFSAAIAANQTKLLHLPPPALTNPQLIENMIAMEKEITSIFNSFYTAFDNILKTLDGYLKASEQALIQAYPVYKNIIIAVNNSPTKLPPSPAVAGLYAYVDGTRGVWKAPANVSLQVVNSVGYQVDDKEHGRINVDTMSGKSINVIRYFTGKGNLIWGARTLAGNDNEWRYISVRRFFNMVEESVKKSTAWAVFEPNDANTWIKVKGMIDNFLTLQWRAGALQGAKTSDAFYVKVGLGETMTSLDILEGRMNVEIGMAVVRPAEFIILTFSHKLAES